MQQLYDGDDRWKFCACEGTASFAPERQGCELRCAFCQPSWHDLVISTRLFLTDLGMAPGGSESSDLMEKSKSMMECMMHLMTDLGMAPGVSVQLCVLRVVFGFPGRLSSLLLAL